MRDCVSCAREPGKSPTGHKGPEALSRHRTLEDVALDILSEFIAARTSFKYLVVITCRYTKLVKVVPLKRIPAWELARAFVTH